MVENANTHGGVQYEVRRVYGVGMFQNSESGLEEAKKETSVGGGFTLSIHCVCVSGKLGSWEAGKLRDVHNSYLYSSLLSMSNINIRGWSC